MWISLCLFVVLAVAAPSGAQNYSYAERPVEDVFFLDSSHGWIVVRDPDEHYLLRTSDGGSNWSQFEVPKGIFKIYFLDPQIGWALALESSGSESAKTYLFRTQNGGKTWKRSPDKAFALCVMPDCSLAVELAFTDEQHGWVIGEHAPGQGVVWETLDGGHTVHKLDLPALNGDACGMYASRTGNIWIFGESTILSSADKGKTWREELVSTGGLKKRAGLFVRSGFIFENGVGWAVGDGGATGLILGTNDFGSSWHIALESSHLTTFVDLSFWDDAHGCAVGPSTSLFCTVDGGKAWSEKLVLPEKTGIQSVFFSRIVMLKSGRGWVLRTGGYLYETVDGGESWHEIDPLKGVNAR
jgi:photosystem II stability/assembly factor-like uncharacterized protein